VVQIRAGEYLGRLFRRLFSFSARLELFRNISSPTIFEYCIQVPANRLGSSYFSVAQLKVAQEVITLTVFAVFSIIYFKEALN
jgi:hypothetical protein